MALVHRGTVVAVGTHRELLSGEPRYRAVVTRETDDETPARPGEDEAVHAIDTHEEIEERA